MVTDTWPTPVIQMGRLMADPRYSNDKVFLLNPGFLMTETPGRPQAFYG